jgi:hypothetical protein
MLIPSPSQRARRPVSVTGMVVCAVLLLTACGGESSASGPHVASVAVPSAAKPASSEPAKADGNADQRDLAQIRLDSTQTEINQINQRWFDCLMKNGMPFGKQGGGMRIPAFDNEHPHPEAKKACTALQPVQPPELSPKTNPQYKDQFREFVKCMKERGVKITLYAEDGSDWGVQDSKNFTPKNELECNVRAYRPAS